MSTIDWMRWHADYDDESSSLHQRLVVVEERIRGWLDEQPAGELRVVSACAGQARDLAGALAGHPRRADVVGVAVELDPDLADDARQRLRAADVAGVDVVVADAGLAAPYAGAVPADLVLLCGVFGNISEDDLATAIRAMPTLCATGATVIWTRHRGAPDLTPMIRELFSDNGFDEVAFVSPGPEQFAVGVQRLRTAPAPFEPAARLFTFGTRPR